MATLDLVIRGDAAPRGARADRDAQDDRERGDCRTPHPGGHPGGRGSGETTSTRSCWTEPTPSTPDRFSEPRHGTRITVSGGSPSAEECTSALVCTAAPSRSRRSCTTCCALYTWSVPDQYEVRWDNTSLPHSCRRVADHPGAQMNPAPVAFLGRPTSSTSSTRSVRAFTRRRGWGCEHRPGQGQSPLHRRP